MKNKIKNIKLLNLLVKNWKLRVWCSLFYSFYVISKITNFNVNRKAFGTSFFYWVDFIKPWSIQFEWILLWLVACLTFYHSSRLLGKIPIECPTFVQQTLEKNFCDVISRVHFQRDYSDQLHFWTTLKWCHVPWILVTPN